MAVIRRKPSDLFKTRIVIAVPPWGVVVVAAAAVLAVFDRMTYWTDVVALVAAILALGCAWVARRMVRDLRYQVHEVLHDIGNDTLDVAPEAEAEADAKVFKIGKDKSA